MKIKILAMSLCAVFALSCKKSDKKDPKPLDPDLKELVLKKRELYLSLQPEALDAHGYAHNKCDSLGFTSLCKAAGGCASADIFLSETEGRWFRSPEKDCFDKGESKSDFSKDMALMLFIYLHELSKVEPIKALEAIGRFRDYAKANNHVMGRPTDTPEGLSRVVMSPALIATMEKLYGKLSNRAGLPYEKEVDEPRDVIIPIINKGFQAHLDVLSIWLSGELDGNVTENDKFVLKKQTEREPRNALFQAAWHLYDDGDQKKALSILTDESLFPAERLPGTQDRCEEYIFQRDDSDDWKPCTDRNETHDGADFLMVLYIAGIES